VQGWSTYGEGRSLPGLVRVPATLWFGDPAIAAGMEAQSAPSVEVTIVHAGEVPLSVENMTKLDVETKGCRRASPIVFGPRTLVRT
jgi:hypothetical protein